MTPATKRTRTARGRLTSAGYTQLMRDLNTCTCLACCAVPGQEWRRELRARREREGKRLRIPDALLRDEG